MFYVLCFMFYILWMNTCITDSFVAGIPIVFISWYSSSGLIVPPLSLSTRSNISCNSLLSFSLTCMYLCYCVLINGVSNRDDLVSVWVCIVFVSKERKVLREEEKVNLKGRINTYEHVERAGYRPLITATTFSCECNRRTLRLQNS